MSTTQRNALSDEMSHYVMPPLLQAELNQLLREGKLNEAQTLFDSIRRDRFHCYAHLYHADTSIYSLALTNDGQRLAMADADTGQIKIWSMETGREYLVIEAPPEEAIDKVAFSPDGKLLASGGYKYEPLPIGLWNVETGERVNTFYGHQRGVNDMQFSPDGRLLATAATDNGIILWDIENIDNSKPLMGHTKPPLKIAFSLDNRLLASCSADCTLRLWEIPSGRCRATLDRHFNRVSDLAFSPDGRLLASCSGGGSLNSAEDFTVRLWDGETGKEQMVFYDHVDTVRGIEFSPQGDLLASWAQVQDDRVALYLVEEMTRRSMLQPSQLDEQKEREWESGTPKSKSTTAATFSPDGTLLAMSTRYEYDNIESCVRLWNVKTEKMIASLDNAPSDEVYKFTPDNLTLILRTTGKVTLWGRAIERTKWEAFQKEKQKFAEANALFFQAQAEKRKQSRKWFFKNFAQAKRLYQQAAQLGHGGAKKALMKLGN